MIDESVVTKRSLKVFNEDLVNYDVVEVEITQYPEEKGAIVQIGGMRILSEDLIDISGLVSYLISR